jgi:hypothetical protein
MTALTMSKQNNIQYTAAGGGLPPTGLGVILGAQRAASGTALSMTFARVRLQRFVKTG